MRSEQFSSLSRFSFFRYCLLITVLAISCQAPEQNNTENGALSDAEKHLPENATRGLTVADDLQITLFAHEPMLVNPTNIDIDAKGRVWVCEGYNYRYSLNPGNPYAKEGDRIVILEDTDGDSVADKQKVFYQGEDINSALGIAVLGNKVIVSRSPNVLVFIDDNNDDIADRRDTLFTGISGEDNDHGVHAFNFGPDGKLYFNFGNASKQLKDKYGNPVKDIWGREINDKATPWRQGMVFRCDADGKNIEVLGNNFRNPYEVAVDSYGTVWQSDNDDDGNRGVRINYVMQHGNFGYRDEITGASWPERRVNLEDSIPMRHWHLNDPGVVPNLLQTGAGSPTGILVYEGNLLPERFRNQLIHSDAGPNIVRSYVISADGAGYTAKVNDIIAGTGDNWFRPSDVCIAPDGSLFISDWYDPGVGGHLVKDFAKGRIYRVTTKGQRGYKIPPQNFEHPAGAVKALESPNLATRYLAYQKLNGMGETAIADLEKLYTSENPRFKARALWLLSGIPSHGEKYIQEGLKDNNPDIRIAALRAALQMKADTAGIVESLIRDDNVQVRREAILALYRNQSPAAASLWAQLATQYDGKDRWYLEALGIAAEGQWDRYFDAWLHQVNDNWNTPAGRDIVWRSRASAALPLLAKIISDPATDAQRELKYFRAFDFHTGREKDKTLLSLLNGKHPQQDFIDALILLQLDESTPRTASLKTAIEKGLKSVARTPYYLDLVKKYNLKDKNGELLRLTENAPTEEMKVSAMRLLIGQGGSNLIEQKLVRNKNNPESLIELLAKTGNDESRKILNKFLVDTKQPFKFRVLALEAAARGRAGENNLLQIIKEKKLPEDLTQSAAHIFSKSTRADLRDEAAKYLNIEIHTHQLPPLEEIMVMRGNTDSGLVAFTTYCGSCHQVKGQGIAFGPDLSEIGSKLSKEALFSSILEPSAGISFGFEGYVFTLKTGATVSGYITSQTNDEISIRMIGGIVEKFRKSDIVSKTPYKESLMPAGLGEAMGAQSLADIVAYLETLKRE